MTDPAEWLRRHPEIADRFSTYFDGSIDSREIMAEILPAILAAHEADLAGRSPVEIVSRAALIYENQLREDEIRGHLSAVSAAAYLAGRRAGREEVAEALEPLLRELEATSIYSASNIRNAIRSLP